MSSIIKVDQIQLADGSTPTAADLGVETPGSILNTWTAYSTATDTTTSTNWVTATNLSIVLTPTSTSSKFILMFNGGGPFINAVGSIICTFGRNGSAVHQAGYGLSRFYEGDPAGPSIAPHSMSFIDAPNTTAQLTYAVFYKSLGGQEVQFNNIDRGAPQFNILEIAG